MAATLNVPVRSPNGDRRSGGRDVIRSGGLLVRMRVHDRAHFQVAPRLADRLRSRGPIFDYWMKHGAGRYGHASVMIGIDATGIIYHDPENAPSATMTISAFNGTRQHWRCALMQRLAGGPSRQEGFSRR